MNHVMIDLETLSTRANACILTVGAIRFDLNDSIPFDGRWQDLPKDDVFYRRVDLESCKRLGMDINERTVEWWKKQSDDARFEAFGGDREDIESVLSSFGKWVGDDSKVWSNGACFDIPILSEAYNAIHTPEPWKFWNVRDTRTIWDVAGINRWSLPKGDEHHALGDCYRQVWGVQEAYSKIASTR